MTTTDQSDKKRPPRFLLNMPDHLRHAMERAAFTSGRTLTAEINIRLEASLKAETPSVAYRAAPTATVVHTNEKGPAGTLSGTDQAMLEIFRRLPPEKQLALLSLFK